ncbi:MAG: hypothetical protein K2Y01_11350, partial [Rhabdochlamydiaceae bacterium]|nr:hypothetical protein [Rhabdochlamydiaceae bacterium]
ALPVVSSILETLNTNALLTGEQRAALTKALPVVSSLLETFKTNPLLTGEQRVAVAKALPVVSSLLETFKTNALLTGEQQAALTKALPVVSSILETVNTNPLLTGEQRVAVAKALPVVSSILETLNTNALLTGEQRVAVAKALPVVSSILETLNTNPLLTGEQQAALTQALPVVSSVANPINRSSLLAHALKNTRKTTETDTLTTTKETTPEPTPPTPMAQFLAPLQQKASHLVIKETIEKIRTNEINLRLQEKTIETIKKIVDSIEGKTPITETAESIINAAKEQPTWYSFSTPIADSLYNWVENWLKEARNGPKAADYADFKWKEADAEILAEAIYSRMHRLLSIAQEKLSQEEAMKLEPFKEACIKSKPLFAENLIRKIKENRK